VKKEHRLFATVSTSAALDTGFSIFSSLSWSTVSSFRSCFSAPLFLDAVNCVGVQRGKNNYQNIS
jgi:hypothetical protein